MPLIVQLFYNLTYTFIQNEAVSDAIFITGIDFFGYKQIYKYD